MINWDKNERIFEWKPTIGARSIYISFNSPTDIWHSLKNASLNTIGIIKDFWHRGKRGYAHSDCWNLDTYIAEVLAGGIKDIKETTIGYPFESSEEEWSQILEELAAGFEYYYKNKFDDDNYAITKKINKTLILFSEWFQSLWW